MIKQNRGSSGEGIWIIKLKAGNYCSRYGDRSCADDEVRWWSSWHTPPSRRDLARTSPRLACTSPQVLELMEANDNHAEEHTVAEFVEFCINGRNAKSGAWTSKGVGKYLEGGKAAGGMLVDQRFCPRIVEGELRYNCVGKKLVSVCWRPAT